MNISLYVTSGQSRFDFIWSVICKGEISTIILIDHTIADPIEELENYIQRFQNYTDNIAIGITHTDINNQQSTLIYKNWFIHQIYTRLFYLLRLEKKKMFFFY